MTPPPHSSHYLPGIILSVLCELINERLWTANINYAYLQMTTFGTEKFEWVAESAQTEDAKTRTKQSCP